MKPTISSISKHEDWYQPRNERWMSQPLADMNLSPAALISNAAYPHGIGQNASTTTDLTGLAKIPPYHRKVTAGMVRNKAAATIRTQTAMNLITIYTIGCTGEATAARNEQEYLRTQRDTASGNVRAGRPRVGPPGRVQPFAWPIQRLSQ